MIGANKATFGPILARLARSGTPPLLPQLHNEFKRNSHLSTLARSERHRHPRDPLSVHSTSRYVSIYILNIGIIVDKAEKDLISKPNFGNKVVTLRNTKRDKKNKVNNNMGNCGNKVGTPLFQGD